MQYVQTRVAGFMLTFASGDDLHPVKPRHFAPVIRFEVGSALCRHLVRRLTDKLAAPMS